MAHGQGKRDELLAQYIGHAPRQRVGGRRIARRERGAPLLNQFALVPDGKAHVGPRQRVTAHRLKTMRELGGVALEELAPRGCGEEQFLDLDGAARAACRRAQFAAAGIEQEGAGLIGGAREQREFRDRGDGGERLAAKAHGRDRLQIAQAGDLARGVAPERQRQFASRDAAAVILHGDQAHATGDQAHGDLRRARIQRVVHEFAHDRGRALHHFAGRDLADQLIGQFVDGAAGRGGHRVVHRSHFRSHR